MKFLQEIKDSLYNASYVKYTPFYHKEVQGPPRGEAGITSTYSVLNDSYAGIVMLVCILLSIVMVAKSSHFISFQFKNLIRTPRENSIQMRETSDEIRYLGFFFVQNVLMLALLAYLTTEFYLGKDEYLVGDYAMMAIYSMVFLLYYVFKEGIMYMVHHLYFPRGQRELYGASRTFLTAIDGFFLLPVMLIHVYLQLNVVTTIHMAASVYILTLLLRFYKCYRIFFSKKRHFLRFFLYLCTLEGVPIVLLVEILFFTANYLKTNI